MQGLEHKPNKETVALVCSYSAGGATQEEIAAVLQISDDTLRKHYAVELKTAKIVYTQKVVGKLREKIEEGSEKSIFFYLTHEGGWKSADKQIEVNALKENTAALERKRLLDEKTEELRQAQDK